MYALLDTFNCRIISRHRTPEAVGRADRRYQRAVKKANGPSSYIPTAIVRIVHGEITQVSREEDEAFFYVSALGFARTLGGKT